MTPRTSTVLVAEREDEKDEQAVVKDSSETCKVGFEGDLSMSLMEGNLRF